MLFCISILVTSCSKAPNYASMIPSDAIAVVDLKLDQIAKHGDLKNADQLSFVKLLRQEIRNEGDELSSLVDGIFDDPASTGLDMQGDVALFVSPSLQVSAVATVKNKSKFDKLVNKILENTGVEVSSVKGTSVIKEDALGLQMAWDKSRLVISFGEKADAMALMDLEKGKSLAMNKDFATYWKNRADISFWYSMHSLLDMVESIGGDEALAELGEYRDEWENASFYANVIFDKGAIRTAFDCLGVDPDSELLKMQQQKFNDKLLAFMPEKTLAAVSMAINMKYLVAYMLKMPDMDEIMNEEVADGITVADLLATISGSMVTSLYDFGSDNDGDPLPLFTAAVDLEDANKVKDLLDKQSLEMRDGCWTVPSVPLFLGIKDNILFVTDNADAAATMQRSGFDKNLAGIASKVKKGNYLYADLDIDHYPASVSGLMQRKYADLLRQYLDRAEYTMTGKTSGEFVIMLKDKKQYSLAATLRFVDDNLMVLADMANSLGDSFADYDYDTEEAVEVLAEDEDYYIDEDYD